jgi:hypothetical protein
MQNLGLSRKHLVLGGTLETLLVLEMQSSGGNSGIATKTTMLLSILMSAVGSILRTKGK